MSQSTTGQAIWRFAAQRKRFCIGAGCILFGILAAGISANVGLSAFLRSSKLRDRVSARTAEELKASAGYLPLSWRGLSVYCQGFLVQGEPSQALTRMEAAGLSARCGLTSLWHGVFVIHELDVQRLQVAYGQTAVGQFTNDLPHQPEVKAPDPNKSAFTVDIHKTVIASTNIWWGNKANALGGLKNVAATIYTINKDLDVTGVGGSFRQEGWPEMKIKQFHLYYAKPNLFVKEGSICVGERDDVSLNGQFTFAEKSSMALALKFDDCPVAPFLPESWREKFRAQFSSQTSLSKEFRENAVVQATGDVHCANASLQGLNAQQKLALITRKPKFRHLKFSTLKGDYSYAGGKLQVKNLEVEAEDLFAVEGSFVVEGENIDADLKVGAKPSVLKTLPGARERVFTEARGGYYWTTVKLTGPLQHPRENLSPRLVEAAKAQIFQGIFKIPIEPEKDILGTLEHLFE